MVAGGTLKRIYGAALAVTTVCVLVLGWSLIPGAFGQAAFLLTVPMAPGTLTLVGALVFTAYNIDPPAPFKWAAIAGAIWCVFLTWSFQNL